jgi:hypothetical protein
MEVSIYSIQEVAGHHTQHAQTTKGKGMPKGSSEIEM